MTVVDGDVIQVRAKMSKGADDLLNVYHFVASLVDDQDDEDVYDAVAQLLDDAYDYIDTQMNDGYDFDTIEAINLTQDVSLGEEAWPTLTTGADTGDNLPMQNSTVVRFPTATLGSQGRKFLGGFTENFNGGSGTVAAALQATLAQYAAALLTGAVIDASNRLIPGNWNDVLERFAPWISAIVNPVFGTQRRRKVGIGS